MYSNITAHPTRHRGTATSLEVSDDYPTMESTLYTLHKTR